MSSGARLRFDGAYMRVEGDLDFATVVPLERQGEIWLHDSAPPVAQLDLAGVKRCNSASTALLLSWLRAARAANKQLTIENVPEDLRSLMQLAGLEDVLPLR